VHAGLGTQGCLELDGDLRFGLAPEEEVKANRLTVRILPARNLKSNAKVRREVEEASHSPSEVELKSKLVVERNVGPFLDDPLEVSPSAGDSLDHGHSFSATIRKPNPAGQVASSAYCVLRHLNSAAILSPCTTLTE